jgi:nitrite reductase/ring-hydroxylating ferredoxin subunit
VTEIDVKKARFVCMLDELTPGTMLRFDLGDTPLVVCRSKVTGEVLAIDARCPHQGALLCFGELTGIQAASGSNMYMREGEIILCPVHRWRIDVRTGEALDIWPLHRTPTYPVSVEHGKIYVSGRS